MRVQFDECIRQIANQGRHSWRDVEVSDDEIHAQLSPQWSKICASGTFPSHHADYYLSVALSRGRPAALRLFESQLVPEIALAVRRLRVASGTSEEVVQLLRIDLLVGDSPRIASYLGTGELAAWLRIIATRRALRLVQRASREQALDEALLSESRDPKQDPTLQYLKKKYAAEMRAALQEAVARLDARQRNLLRQHVIDGLSIDELAQIYAVHRATCARWLSDARTELAKGTRRALSASMGGSAELESVLRMLNTSMDLSINRLLGPHDD